MKPIAVRFWTKVERGAPDECWLWTGAGQSKGYGKIGVGGRAAGSMLAHRCSWELHYGRIPDGLFVCHSCDVRLCVNPRHLFLGTCAENLADMVAKDRHLRGERSSSAKLTDAAVLAIRASAEPSNMIAKRYGVNGSHIRSIRRGECWKHLATQSN